GQPRRHARGRRRPTHAIRSWRERAMFTVTGTNALRIADAHRRLRRDLRLLEQHERWAAAEPDRLDAARTTVLGLLDGLVLPLADVEDDVIDLTDRADRPTGAAVAERAEHDVVRE